MSATAYFQNLAAKPKAGSKSNPTALLLQRKCACKSPTASLTGECAECTSRKRLQTKLAMDASNGPLEKEADRVADQVLVAPANLTASGAPPQIQRFTEQANVSTESVPASVDHALASPASPLNPALRQDMEQRFGHDFSQVRVHAGALAQQSARDVEARAYTVGHHLVFGAGEYQPGSAAGRRLLAHELTHVVQQSPSGRSPWPGTVLARSPDPKAPPPPPPPVTTRSNGLTGAEWSRIAEARRFFNLPAQPTASRTTIVGVLVMPSGEELFLRSGEDDGPYGGPSRGGIPRGRGEAFSGGGASQGNIATHVEGKATAVMHQRGISRATLLIEEPPCRICDSPTATPSITRALPPGATLTVVDPGAAGIYRSSQRPPSNPSPTAPVTPTTPTTPPPPSSPQRPPATTVTSGEGGGPGTGGAGSAGARPTYAGRGAIVAPIVTSGPSAARTAAANGLVELAQFGNRVLGHFADETQAALAQAQIEMHLKSIASFWEQSPEQGVLLSVTWEVTHYSGGDVRRFVNVKERHGLTQAIARRTNANVLTEEPNPKLDVQSDEIWIDPPSPEAVHKLPAPFPKIALATFAKRDEVQDVKWKGVSTFDDNGFTALKPVPGGIANFFVLQPPSELTFMNGRMRQTTSVPILHRSAPNGWTIPVVNLDTVVGYLPFVDRDTAAMIVPADAYTAALFKGSSAVDAATSQLRLYDFSSVRFVSPGNIEVLKSLSESDMPTPKNLSNMKPQDWADMSVAVQGHEARELWNRITARGRKKVRPEFVRQFMTMLPADLTMAEVDILSADPGVQRADLSEDALLDAWRDAIARLREKPASGATATDEELRKLVVDKLAKSNWTGVPADAIYFRSETDPEKGPVGLAAGSRISSFCYGTAKGIRYGALVTLTVGAEAEGRTPVTVDAVRSPIVDTNGIVLAGASYLLGKTFRISPRKTLATKTGSKPGPVPAPGDARKP